MATLNNLDKIYKIKLPTNVTYAIIDLDGRAMIAENYTAGVAYEAGAYVIYQDNFFRITSDISVAENTGWLAVTKTQVTIGSELTSLRNSLTTGIHYRGVTTTALYDNATTNPIVINGEDYTAVAGDLVIYDDGTNELEFLFDGTNWNEFGSTGTLKAMAFADTASGSSSVSVTGTASAQTFTGTQATISISGNVTGTGVTITPTSADKVSVTPFASGGSFTQGSDVFEQGQDSFSAGSYSVSNGELSITLPTFSQGSDSFVQGSDTFVGASGGTAVDVLKSIPTPSVTQGSFSGSTTYTPAGTNGSSSVSASGTVSITVTPDTI